MKKITRKTIIFLKHLLPVTWYRKLTNRQKLYVMTGVIAFLLVLIPSIIYSLSNTKKAEASWYNDDWKYRKQLTFNNADQSTNLTNFPVMIKLTSSNFSFDQAKEDGSDVRFTDSDGATLLEYEIEEYNKTGKSAVIWVKVPQIDASSSTDNIYLYWGNSSAVDAQNKDNVWESNYKAIYHLNENSESAYAYSDSSGYVNNLTTKDTTSKSYQSNGNTGGSTSSPNFPNAIPNQPGGNSEIYPSIKLDENDFPVIAYHDDTNDDLLLMHCNDKECKGNDESIVNLDSLGSTGFYSSLQLDSNGYPVIAYYDSTDSALNFIHCNDVNCSGGDETIVVLDSSGTTGQYPFLLLDGSGKPVIMYYDSSATDLQLIHCDDVNCQGTESIQTIDGSGTTVGNQQHGSMALDANGFPVMSYYDSTNTDLKVAHCNDVNCSGTDESIVTVAGSGINAGTHSSLKLDQNGFPMIAYYDTTNTDLVYLHCTDANCSGSITSSILTTSSSFDYPWMELDQNGNPIITTQYTYPTLFVCSDTNCSSVSLNYLTRYNQYGAYVPTMDIDSNGYPVVTVYSRGRNELFYEIDIYTTNPRISQAYDSDFNFSNGSFTTSLWFKTNGLVANNYLLTRYDNDQGFKVWLDYGGHACFGIDDDSSWGPDDKACTTNSLIENNVDNGQAAGLDAMSMKLDANGYPVIAYFDASSSQYNLELIHCNDVNCSGGDENKAVIDSTDDVGRTPSMILDVAGNPVITYHDNTNQDLKIVHCGDANCSSGNVINTIDSTGDVGDYPSLQLDSNGYPVIGYYDTTNTAIKLTHCNDVNCSGGDESIVTVDNTEVDRPYITTTWMKLDANDYPVMAYYNETAGDLKVAHCNDTNCSGGNESITTPATSGTVGRYTSIDLNSSGFPVIAYYDYTNWDLRLMRCNDVNCQGLDETINVVEENKETGYYYIDLELNSSDIPVILHTSLANWMQILTVCSDIYCTSETNTNSYIRQDPYNYYYGSMELDSNEYPVVAMSRYGDLTLLHMDNTTEYVDNNAYDDGNWHHLVAVKDSTSSIKLYIDGVEVASDTSTVADATLTSDSAELHLGENLVAIGSYKYWLDTFGGQIDEVQIDNTARSADWIKAQYLSESDNFITYETTPAKHSLTATDNSVNPKDYLVAHYKFDEGYGTTANNVGYGEATYNGNITNATWTNDGKFGKSLSFPGNNDARVEIPWGSGYDVGSNNFTLSIWVRPHVASGNVMFASFGTSTDNRRAYFGRYNGYWDMGIRNQAWGSGNTPVTTNWNHIAVVFDSNQNTATMYVNGKYSMQKSYTDYQLLDNLKLGVYGDNTYDWNGQIDEVKIYNAALTEDQIKLDMNQGKSLVLGSLSDTSQLSGGSIASNSASAIYCVPGSSDTCSPPVGEWKMEEFRGTSTYDTSGNNNTGTITGASWTMGKVGSALNFINNGDGVNAGSSSTTAITGDMTLEAWVYPTTSTGWAGIVSRWGSNWAWALDSTSHRSAIYINTADAWKYSNSNVPINKWSHLAVVYSDSSDTVTFYLNGVYDGSSSQPNNPSSTAGSLTIGQWGNNYYFKGKIDEAKVFNYARTASQIAWDYNKGAPVGHWKFDECQGTTAYDISGNGNNATVNIGATGTQATAGTCSTPSDGTGAWYNGNSGKYNHSMSFDGVDDYVSIADSTSMDSAIDEMTFTAWVKPASDNNSGDIWKREGVWYSYYDSDHTFNFTTYDTTPQVLDCTKALTAEQWNHVALIYSDITNTKSIYVNGKLAAQDTNVTGQMIGGNALEIGRVYTNHFKGAIDDMKIYNYALNSTQVKNVMNQGAAVRWGPSQGTP